MGNRNRSGLAEGRPGPLYFTKSLNYRPFCYLTPIPLSTLKNLKTLKTLIHHLDLAPIRARSDEKSGHHDDHQRTTTIIPTRFPAWRKEMERKGLAAGRALHLVVPRGPTGILSDPGSGGFPSRFPPVVRLGMTGELRGNWAGIQMEMRRCFKAIWGIGGGYATY